MIPSIGSRNKVVALITAFFFLFSISNSNLLFAQTNDEEPPKILLDKIKEGERGENQIFIAEVSDNKGVKRVRLNYRFSGNTEYIVVEMNEVSTGKYQAVVATDSDSSSPIEYYIEAEDTANNLTLEGFSFEPLKRWLDPADSRVSNAAQPAVEKKSNTMLYVLGGLVVLGLAGLAGSAGGSGGGDPATGDSHTIKLTITEP